jgi:hypothetical protein
MNMKTLKIYLLVLLSLMVFSCSEEKMDEINMELNDALNMSVQSMLPDIILKSGFETASTDIAWYATVYIEHSTGTWAQSSDADKRIAQNASTLFNNSWNSLYDVLNICKDIITRTAPDGPEASNQFVRGVAQVLTAYNLATATDMWGEIPWAEALQGPANLQPKYDKQSTIYPLIQQYLDEGIASLTAATNISGTGDYAYKGDKAKWIKAANSLKARYYLRLSVVDNQAASKALGVISKGLASNSDNFYFNAYEATATGENPWVQFMADRSHLSVSKSFYDLMMARTDPRIAKYFTLIGGAVVPAPNGTADQTQGGKYSVSLITTNGRTLPSPIMTYHELMFIQAEAQFRTGNASWKESLQKAIEANFVFKGLTLAEGTAYYTGTVVPLLTSGNELKEILVQKYIGLYEHEAIEAYNDYRRVPSFLTLKNPNNATVGFVWRFPYPTSEESSNSANIPTIDIYKDKVWWAGGTEK